MLSFCRDFLILFLYCLNHIHYCHYNFYYLLN